MGMVYKVVGEIYLHLEEKAIYQFFEIPWVHNLSDPPRMEGVIG